MQNEKYMRRALELALLAEGNTSPNPMVGCVIVNDDGEIVGEGYHHKAGQAHAEVNALRAAGPLAQGATAYVTLEPCSHYGRTGPCCEALAAAGVKKVVAACLDPNPLVAGRGVKYLQNAGIEVVCGVCEKEARRLNEKFFCWITQKRPFISLKYAMTLDGKIAAFTGDSKWITGVEARTFAHELRKRHDAVLVGVGTVLADDPELTTRMVEGKNPLRVVLDSALRTPLSANIINSEAQTLIICGADADKVKREALENAGAQVIAATLENGKVPVKKVIEILAERQITGVLVEGGSEIHGAFKDEGLADRVYAFIAPKIIGGKAALTPVGGSGSSFIKDGWKLGNMEYLPLGEDLLITALVAEGGR